MESSRLRRAAQIGTQRMHKKKGLQLIAGVLVAKIVLRARLPTVPV
jgi:hypothetical protein